MEFKGEHSRGDSSEVDLEMTVQEETFVEPVSQTENPQEKPNTDKPFQCETCQRSFKLRKDLFRHQKIHTGEKPFQCSICKRWFSRKSHLASHLRTHTGEKPFECHLCHKSFSEKSYLTKHLLTHTEENAFITSDSAEESLPGAEQFGNLKEKKPFKCNLCDKTFCEKKRLFIHFRSHAEEKAYECSECGKCMSPIVDLDNPVQDENIEETVRQTNIPPEKNKKIKSFQCDLCFRSFTLRKDLFRHQKIHTGEKPFQCSICSSRFSRKSHLASHLRTHTGEKPYDCHLCHKSFSEKSYLTKHLLTHGEENMNIITSDSAEDSLSLTKQSSNQKEKKSFKCNLCEKTFCEKNRLFIHFRSHTGEKPFECSECGKCFSQKGSLSNHMTTHMEDKPFKCGICFKSFGIKSKFTRHLRMHTDDKPYKCKICGKSFKHRHEIPPHLKLHVGERPYQCSDCHRSLVRRQHVQVEVQCSSEDNTLVDELAEGVSE